MSNIQSTGAAIELTPPYLVFLGDAPSPAYAGVSLGLLHGSQPDAIVVCHDPGGCHYLR